jgi:hypothetical protein
MFLGTRWRMAAISAAAPIGLCGISPAPAQIITPPIPPLAPGNWYGPAPWSLPNSPFGLWAGTLSLDYARLIPSVGTNGNQIGGNGAGLWMFSDNLGLNTDFGYHNITRALTPALAARPPPARWSGAAPISGLVPLSATRAMRKPLAYR